MVLLFSAMASLFLVLALALYVGARAGPRLAMIRQVVILKGKTNKR